MSFYDLDEESKLMRARQLVAKDKYGTKQLEKVSEHSPGPVADSELLARSLDYPNKFTAMGGVDETLFQDAFTHGASAQRLIRGWEAHAADIHNRFEERAKARREGTDGRDPNSNNKYVGAFCMTAGELRACKLDRDTGPRVRVYDAGEESDDLHAEIIVDDTGLNRPEKKELRVRLMTIAQQQGLFVSPYLPADDLSRAEGTQCTLHMPGLASGH
jgi:hypothetical protein